MGKQTLNLMKLVFAGVAARAQVSLSPDHERLKVKN